MRRFQRTISRWTGCADRVSPCRRCLGDSVTRRYSGPEVRLWEVNRLDTSSLEDGS